MIAEIYPIKRMPGGFRFFDYKIPDELKITRGDMVLIPFRKKELFGIVSKTKPSSSSKFELKNIISKTDINLTDQELRFYEQLAKKLNQSIPSVLNASLQTPLKRELKANRRSRSGSAGRLKADLTIPTSEIEAVKQIVHDMKQTGSLQIPDIRRMTAVAAAYIRENPGPNIIVTPNLIDAELIRQHLPNSCFISGNESKSERFRNWNEFRQSRSKTLIGTRMASLITHPNLKNIFIIRSSHENHFQADQNPKYDSRKNAKLMKQIFKCRSFNLDILPISKTYFNLPNISIIKKNAFVSYDIENSIRNALAQNKKILCVYNWVKKGFDNQQMRVEMQKLFPKATIDIIDKNHPQKTDANILLVTNYYLEQIFNPFNPPIIDLIALLDPDTSLFKSEISALENAYKNLEEWRGLAYSCKAEFMIQTDSDELFRQYLTDPQAELLKEIETRKAYNID